MRTIHKQTLKIQHEQEIVVPAYSKLLCVKEQFKNEDPCIWYLCDPKEAPVKRAIYCHGTGHDIDKEYDQYLGTVIKLDGKSVFHFFVE